MFRVPRSALGTPHSALRIPHSRTPHSALRVPRSLGFTLIELLSSLTILAIIIGLLAVTLNLATDTWHEARIRARLVADGRAAMEFIAQDLRQAVADTNGFLFAPDVKPDSLTTYGATNSYITFCRLANSTTYPTSSVEYVTYGIGETNRLYVLERSVGHLTFDDSSSNVTTVALLEGVAALRFDLPPDYTNSAAASAATSAVPAYVDCYLELLHPDDALAALALGDTEQRALIERHVVRLSRRIHLPAYNRWDLP